MNDSTIQIARELMRHLNTHDRIMVALYVILKWLTHQMMQRLM